MGLDITYHVMSRMRNENCTYKYGDFWTPKYLWNSLETSYWCLTHTY